jgi:hypothetical protein
MNETERQQEKVHTGKSPRIRYSLHQTANDDRFFKLNSPKLRSLFLILI